MYRNAAKVFLGGIYVVFCTERRNETRFAIVPADNLRLPLLSYCYP